MARYKHPAVKKRLAKKAKQSKWAPFWSVPKKYSPGRRVHPGRHTVTKRSWRRTKTKA
jgi:ribosomal protein L39E